MALREALDAAIRFLHSGEGGPGLDTDGRWATSVGTWFHEADEPELPIHVELSPTGERFTVLTPLGIVVDGGSDGETLAALMTRHVHADHVGGGHFGLIAGDDAEILVLCHHWMLPAIDADGLRGLLGAFAESVDTALDEIRSMAEQGAPIQPPGGAGD